MILFALLMSSAIIGTKGGFVTYCHSDWECPFPEICQDYDNYNSKTGICGPKLACSPEKQCQTIFNGPKVCCKDDEICRRYRPYDYCYKPKMTEPTTPTTLLPPPKKCRMEGPKEYCSYPERCVAKTCKINKYGRWLCEG